MKTEHIVDNKTEYLKDMKGRLVPVELIKPVDIARDDLVNQIASEAINHHKSMKGFKLWSFSEILAFMELSAEEYGAKIGGNKGNVTLHNFDGSYRVQIQVSDYVSFDERLQTAKSLIDDCIQGWSEGINSNIKLLIDDAFQVDKQGNVSTYRILGLRKHKIEDEKWQQAMKAIADSVQVVGSKKYIRVYKRDDETGAYLPISLDIAKV